MSIAKKISWCLTRTFAHANNHYSSQGVTSNFCMGKRRGLGILDLSCLKLGCGELQGGCGCCSTLFEAFCIAFWTCQPGLQVGSLVDPLLRETKGRSRCPKSGDCGMKVVDPRFSPQEWLKPLIWRFPEIGVPPQSSISMAFSLINQLLRGTPIYGNPHLLQSSRPRGPKLTTTRCPNCQGDRHTLPRRRPGRWWFLCKKAPPQETII